MKNKLLKLAIILLVSILALPINTDAKTIAQYEAEVEAFEKELAEKQSSIDKNDAEVAQINKRIKEIETQVTKAIEEIKTLQIEIDKSNEEIKEKSQESKKIIEYYQISNGENIYLEYAFGATSITDMIYRMSVVEQLTAYNEKIMAELEELITKNIKQQEELNTKAEQLNKLQKELVKQKEKLLAENAALRVGMPSIEEQLKAAKSNVAYYKKLGCGQTEDIQDCQYRVGGGSVPSVNGFYRPMYNGYVVRGVNSSHIGYDVSSNNKSIPIYPIADGQLFFAGFDNAGAYIVVLRHNVGGRYLYATYAHMRSFSSAIQPYVNYRWGTSESISNGPIISHTTSLGNMGSTGNSTGPHLHLEMSECSWHKQGGCLKYSEYLTKIVDPSNYVRFPSSWNNR